MSGEKEIRADFKIYFTDSAINRTHYIEDEETEELYHFQILDIELGGWYYLV